MEDEGVGLALAKAVDLRLKINTSLHKANAYQSKKSIDDGRSPEKENGGLLGAKSGEEEEDQEDERLLHIRDALESLESQLSHLQELHQQQQYEREVVRAEIEHSRQVLYRRLKDYKGEELQVIREASAFVGDTLETDQDLMLPPYRRIPQSLFTENQFLPLFPSPNNPPWNGAVSKEGVNSKNGKPQANSGKWLGRVIGAVSKTVITVAGVMSVLSLCGLRANVVKSGLSFNIQRVLHPSRSLVECPAGRILYMEDGEARCVVKERVAVPFESLPVNPDVNYGCG